MFCRGREIELKVVFLLRRHLHKDFGLELLKNNILFYFLTGVYRTWIHSLFPSGVSTFKTWKTSNNIRTRINFQSTVW